MIRKISLFIIASIIATWLIAAHVVKNKLILIANNFASDNVKFSYQDTELSGFPFNWQITFIDPKIEIIGQNNSSEISLQKLNVKLNYLMKDVDLKFGNAIYYNSHQNGIPLEYKFASDEDVVINLKFDEALCFLRPVLDWKKIAMSTKLNMPKIYTSVNSKQLFNLSDITLLFDQKDNTDFNRKDIKISANYSSSEKNLKTDNALLILDFEYLNNNGIFDIEKKLDFEHKINISKINLTLNDSSINISGASKFSRNSAPRGDLNISFNKPNDIIELLLSDNFISRNSSIRQIISKINFANLQDDSDNYKKSNFKIHFSEKGISITKLNYLESKIE